MNYVFAFALGLGFAAGLRSLTPPAVAAWAAHLGWLNLNNSPLAFMGSIITAVSFLLNSSTSLPPPPQKSLPVQPAFRVEGWQRHKPGGKGSCFLRRRFAATRKRHQQPSVDRAHLPK